MPELIVLVLDDGNKVNEVVNAWLEVGISGVTLVDSAGLGHQFAQHGARGDVPLMPSLESLLRVREERSRTLFIVVPDGFDVDALIAATEAITGSLDDPDTGILFTIPVTRAKGLHRRRP
jgi:nitrogen regulatory protein P-II 1